MRLKINESWIEKKDIMSSMLLLNPTEPFGGIDDKFFEMENGTLITKAGASVALVAISQGRSQSRSLQIAIDFDAIFQIGEIELTKLCESKSENDLIKIALKDKGYKTVKGYLSSIKNKREALLEGFIWSRTSRTKHKISVTREDSVTLLVECKAKFELDILTKKDPNIDIVTFQNGTIIKNLNPDELEMIIIEGASVRAEIESKYAVD